VIDLDAQLRTRHGSAASSAAGLEGPPAKADSLKRAVGCGRERALVALAARRSSKAREGANELNMNAQQAQRRVLQLAAAILFMTGVLKLVSLAFGENPSSLGAPNPVVPILSEGMVIFSAGVMEIVIAMYLWRPPANRLKHLIVLWTASIFFMYRSILEGMATASTCRCLGIATGPLLSVQENISLVLLAILFGSGLFGTAISL
jgi:hypothetical protein